MEGTLERIPLEGKVLGFREDTKVVSAGFSSRRELTVSLIVKSEFFGRQEEIPFVRSGDRGDVLNSLIEDFKNGKNLHIKGTISYPLRKPPSITKELFKDIRCLEDTTNWETIKEEEKEKLKKYTGRFWPLEIDAQILVQEKPRYMIVLPRSEGKFSGHIWHNTSAQIYLF